MIDDWHCAIKYHRKAQYRKTESHTINLMTGNGAPRQRSPRFRKWRPIKFPGSRWISDRPPAEVRPWLDKRLEGEALVTYEDCLQEDASGGPSWILILLSSMLGDNCLKT